MSAPDDGGPAFPMPFQALAAGPNTTLTVPYPGDYPTGMSLRDWFAGTATDKDLEVLLDGHPEGWHMDRQEARYAHADRMLVVRKSDE